MSLSFTLIVCTGRGLTVSGGTPSAYVYVTYEGRSKQTSQKSSKSPNWDERLVFSDVTHKDDALQLQVYHKGWVGSTLIGGVEFDLKNLPSGGLPRSLPLHDSEGNLLVGAEIQIKVVKSWADEEAAARRGERDDAERRRKLELRELEEERRAVIEAELDGTDSSSGDSGDSKMKRETKQMRKKAEKIVSSDLARMKSIAATVEQTNDAASDTATALADQGDQLRRIRAGMERVHDDITVGEDLHKRATSLAYSVAVPRASTGKERRKHEKKDRKSGHSSSDTRRAARDTVMEGGRTVSSTSSSSSSASASSSSSSSSLSGSGVKREKKFLRGGRLRDINPEMGGMSEKAIQESDEIDDTLDIVSDGVSRLRVKAQAINEELDSHNRILDDINSSADRATSRLKKQNRKLPG